MVIALFFVGCVAALSIMSLGLLVPAKWRTAYWVVLGGLFALIAVCYLWFAVGTGLYDNVVFDPKKGEQRTAFYQIEKDEVGVRGTFGDMFGVVGALFSALSLAGAVAGLIFQQVQLNRQQKEINEQNVRERKRDREAKERLLIELSQQYWSPQFYDIRERAWSLIHIVKDPLTSGRIDYNSLLFDIDIKHQRTRQRINDYINTLALGNRDPVKDEFAREHAVLIAEEYQIAICLHLVRWLVLGNIIDRDVLKKHIYNFVMTVSHFSTSGFIQSRPYAEADWSKLAEDLPASLVQVINHLGVYASIWCQEAQAPLTDYMGNQWDSWGPPLRDVCVACVEMREKLRRQPPFWEEPLLEYDRRYRERHSSGKASV